MTASIGPYDIVSALGRGGMGEVHRARHRVTGALVALKTVRTAHAATLEGIRREIHALAQLSHPAIVRIVDEGTHEGIPWYAMELLEGRTLRQHVAGCGSSPVTDSDRPGAPEAWWTTELHAGAATERIAEAAHDPVPWRPQAVDLGTALSLGQRICEPLAYLHGEGLVHRDLKPENVVVRADGTPVLVDFGLSARVHGPVGRDQLQVPELYVGTPAYMSPEQVLGHVVDARSDVYSLGCILYELLTGQPPFVDQPFVVMQMHARAVPVAPSRLVGGLPATVDALVMRLLAKDPRQRMGYADDVARRLADIDPGVAVAPSGPRPRTYLYRPALVGRQESMRVVGFALDDLGRRRGTILMVGGECGVGKTRLLTELALEARLRGAEVLTGACAAGGEPIACLRRPLRAVGDWCRENGPGAVARVLGHRAKLLARYEPSLASLPGVDTHPEPVELPAEAARLRLARSLVDVFVAFSRERPLVIALDDLHGADDLTVAFLDLHARDRHDGPLLLAGSFRSEELREPISRVLGLPGVTVLQLDGLSPADVEALVAEMLALPRSPGPLGPYLTRRSEGNPLFVAEYLRLLVAEGMLDRDGEGIWRVGVASKPDATEADYEALPLPGSLRDLLSRRLQGLGAEAARVLAWAAVLGRDPDSAALARLCGPDDAVLMTAFRELARVEVLETGPEGHRFTHDQLRELAYDAIDPRDRARRHREAALAIEGEHAADLDAHAASLGRHWELAGDRDRAREGYLRGARRALALHALDETERLLRAHLALVTSPSAESVVARRLLAHDVLARRGRSREAEEELRVALAEAEGIGEPKVEAATRRVLGLLLNGTGRPQEAREALERALSLARRAGDPAITGTVLGTLAILELEQGRADAAGGLYAEALDAVREAGNRQLEGALLGNMGVAQAERGRMDLAEPLLEQSLALARAIGDRRDEGLVLGNLAGLRYRQGKVEEARVLFEQALAIAGDTGDLRYEAVTRGNIANLLLDEGRVEDARAMYEAAHAIFRSLGARRNEGVMIASLGAVHAEGGRAEEAEACYAEALAIARGVGDRWGEARVLGNLARVQEEQGRFEEASASYEEALAITRETSDRRFEGIVRAGQSWIALATRGDAAGAERLAREAEALLREATDRKELARVTCLLGHIALFRGEPAADALSAARALRDEIGARPRSVLARDVDVLARAQGAHDVGRPLLAGHCREDLSPGQLRWLEEHGPGGMRLPVE